MDYRLKQNRKEGFRKWYKWSLENKDCDPAIWMINYIFDRFEFNKEQKLWLCWLYANTYYFPTSYILWNEFPDYELVDLGRLTKWNDNNYRRLRYQTDTKYNKGHLPEMFRSYRITIPNEQSKYFEKFYCDNEQQTFDKLWKNVNDDFYKFGRYTTWFYLQSLKQCCHLPIEPSSLFLSDYSGSKSHRNGLCCALGKDDWIDERLTTSQYQWLEEEVKELYVDHPDSNPFTMETCLCSYKKIFRTSRGRYLGYYLDRQSEEISTVEKDGWNGIDWDVLWQAREETLHPYLAKRNAVIQTQKYTSFLETGNIEYVPNKSDLEKFLV